jgi:TPR repeat protein
MRWRLVAVISVLCGLAVILAVYRYKRQPEAVPSWRRAAEQGEARAQFKLGMMNELGVGVPQDDTEAVDWYRKAAERIGASAVQPGHHVRGW